MIYDPSDYFYYIRFYTDNYKNGTFSLDHLEEKLWLLESEKTKWENHRNYKSYFASVAALKKVINMITTKEIEKYESTRT